MGIGDRFAVLAYDARGHGQSGGLIGIDGPKEIADVKAVFAWLRARPDVSDTRIGGWGVSYGGGAAWNSLAAGVPWAALEISMSWVDLRDALLPQGLAKTGVIAGFLGSLDPKRIDPEVLAIRDAAYAGTIAPVLPFAAARTSLPALKGVKTPVFMMQGRRDFAFGMEHALNAYRALAGPKQLWFGLSGHAPSPGVAADTPAMLAEGARWFDRYVGGKTTVTFGKPVAISPESWKGQPVRFAGAAEGRDDADRVRGEDRLRPVREAPADAAAPHAPDRGVRLAGRPGERERDRRLVAHRRRPQRAHAGRQGDRRRGRRRAGEGREAHVPHRARQPGDVPPEGLEADGDDRLVVARPESRQPALPRPAVPVHRASRRSAAARCGFRSWRRPSPDEARTRGRGRGRARRRRRRRRHDERRPRRHADVGAHRRHRPALRRGRRVRHRRAGGEGVLRLRQLDGRGQRAEGSSTATTTTPTTPRRPSS